MWFNIKSWSKSWFKSSRCLFSTLPENNKRKHDCLNECFILIVIIREYLSLNLNDMTRVSHLAFVSCGTASCGTVSSRVRSEPPRRERRGCICCHTQGSRITRTRPRLTPCLFISNKPSNWWMASLNEFMLAVVKSPRDGHKQLAASDGCVSTGW